MRIPIEKKAEYWDYFTSPAMKDYRPHGVTDTRLAKVKQYAMAYSYLWDDVVVRHGGLDKTPVQMAQDSREVFEHCIGNFYGILVEYMYQLHIIKHL